MCNKKFFFREFGSGTPLVFLHGIMGCSDYWIPFVQHFDKNFKVILIDLPNHGKSLYSDTINFPQTAELLSNFFEENNIIQPFVVAHSYGAKVAFQMLAQNPNCLSALVAVDMLPNSSFVDKKISKIMNFLQYPLPPLQDYSQVKNYLSACGFAGQYLYFLQKALNLKSSNTPSWKFNALVIYKDKDLITNNIQFEKETSTPILVLKGGNSEFVNTKDYESLKPIFKNIVLHEVKGSGHWIQVENPDEFINTTNNFFNSLT